jgi:hypothetical protein
MTARRRGFRENYHPQEHVRVLIEQVKAVLEEYADYLPLTLRQIFYRLVGSIGYKKDEKAYGRLGDTIVKARRAGIIDFAHIRDDGLVRDDPFGYDNIEGLMGTFERFINGYTLNRQIGQPFYTLMACEAAGMVPQLTRIARPFGVSVISGGGFDSVTAKYQLAQELAASERPVRLLHIGDYDPSGVHMYSALIEDALAFLEQLNPEAVVTPERVAVLPKHVKRFKLTTAPAKEGDDRRFAGIGDDPTATVQAEALKPSELATLVKAALRSKWDRGAAADLAAREQDERERLARWWADARP